jgi:sec-independent protein translocase protein TatA
MFGVGFPELLVILVVCLLIFGPGKLPEIGEALGKGIRDFQRALKQPPKTDSTPLPSSAKETKEPEQD